MVKKDEFGKIFTTYIKILDSRFYQWYTLIYTDMLQSVVLKTIIEVH